MKKCNCVIGKYYEPYECEVDITIESIKETLDMEIDYQVVGHDRMFNTDLFLQRIKRHNYCHKCGKKLNVNIREIIIQEYDRYTSTEVFKKHYVRDRGFLNI